MTHQILQGYQHLLISLVMMTGLYVVMSYDNLVKKLIGVGLMQASVFIFFIFGAQLQGGGSPVIETGVTGYANPLPHVLILTAIVVNVAATALGLALIIGIDRAFTSLDEAAISKRELPGKTSRTQQQERKS